MSFSDEYEAREQTQFEDDRGSKFLDCLMLSRLDEERTWTGMAFQMDGAAHLKERLPKFVMRGNIKDWKNEVNG